MKVFRGRLMHSLIPNNIEVLNDAVIGYEDNGQIIFIDNGRNMIQLQKSYGFNDSDVQTLLPSQFLIPGFVDTHIHAPQYRFTGTGYDKQLLDWLDTYTFPTETKFSDTAVAHEVYPQVVRRTLCNGTTTASYFATIHLESTKELCKVISKYGQRALVGKVNMDCRSPPDYIETTEDSIRDTIAFVDFVKEMKNPLIKSVITPRFSPICTETLMKQLAQIATENDLHIQSHLCEQLSEIDYILNDCYPNHKNCTDIFDKVGILTEKTYMAHCVHMTDEELELLKERKVGIAHCPLSNFCLRSGHMDARDKLSRGMKIGLGTDVSGGFSASILDAIRNAILASKSIYIKNEEQQRQLKEQQQQSKEIQYKPITLDEAFFMATLGGAQVLCLDDQIGNFQVGKQFDALVIDTKISGNFDIFPDDDFKDILSKFLFLGDDRNIVRVFVAGREVINKLS